MLANRPQVKKWVSVTAVVGFVVFLLYMFFAGNLGQMVAVMGDTNVPIYVLAFLCVVASATFDAATWYGILRKLSVKVRFRVVFNLNWVGSFVDAIIPGGWSGDIFKAYLLSKERIDGPKIAASIVVKKVFELLVTLGVLVVSLVLLGVNYSLSNSVVIAIGVVMGLLSLPLVVILYLSLNATTSETVLRWIRRLSGLIRGKRSEDPEAENRLRRSLSQFQEGIVTIRKNPKAMLEPLLFQAVGLVFNILALYLIFASIGYLVSPDKVIITNSIVTTIQTQGVALAGFSPVVSSTIYSVLGISPLISISSSLLASFPTFWFKFFVSFVFFEMVVFDRQLPSFGFLKNHTEKIETVESSSSL